MSKYLLKLPHREWSVSSTKEIMSFQFGVLQNVLGEPLETVFATARELGFDGVEVDWNAPEDILEGGPLAPEKRAAIKTSAQESGVVIHSVAAHFHNQAGIASIDPEIRDRAIHLLREGLYMARDLGATALLVPFFGPGERDLASPEGQKRMVMALQLLAGDAAKAGVYLAIEHVLPGEQAARLIDATISTHVGAYWDMGNGMTRGIEPIADVRALGSRIARVHAKEFSRFEGESRPLSYHGLNQVPLGQGDVPITEVLRELKRAGYKGFITLETGGFDDRKASALAARQVLAQAAASL